MAKKKIEPTDKEMSILRIIWDKGEATVREVHDEMNKHRQVGYTTTLKLMQIMVEKGLLDRDESAFKHVYRSAVSEEKTQSQVVSSMMDKVFGGSAEKLVMRALSTKKVSPDELKKIKKMIREIEKK